MSVYGSGHEDQDETSCPFCRGELMHRMPLILNYTANSTARKYVEKMSESDAEGCQDGGTRLRECTAREE